MKYCVPCTESVYVLFSWTKGFLADACKKPRLLPTAQTASTQILPNQGFFMDTHASHFLCDLWKNFGYSDSWTEAEIPEHQSNQPWENLQQGSGSHWEGQAWKWADHSQVLICKSCPNSSVWCLMKCLLYSKLPNCARKRQLNPEQPSSNCDSQTSQRSRNKARLFLRNLFTSRDLTISGENFLSLSVWEFFIKKEKLHWGVPWRSWSYLAILPVLCGPLLFQNPHLKGGGNILRILSALNRKQHIWKCSRNELCII